MKSRTRNFIIPYLLSFLEIITNNRWTNRLLSKRDFKIYFANTSLPQTNKSPILIKINYPSFFISSKKRKSSILRANSIQSAKTSAVWLDRRHVRNVTSFPRTMLSIHVTANRQSYLSNNQNENRAHCLNIIQPFVSAVTRARIWPPYRSIASSVNKGPSDPFTRIYAVHGPL